MIGKKAFTAVLAYLLFGLAMYIYLFYLADTSIPDRYRGTGADPSVFLNSREWLLSEEFSKIKNLLFFLSTPYEWLFYFLILITGASAAIERWSSAVAKNFVLRTAIYLFWLLLASFAVMFPLNYISYTISKMYHISTQGFSSWLRDGVVDFWVNYATMLLVVTVLYALMKKFQKNWWLAAWVLTIPFTIFMMFLRPVIIDPLYNDFYPLQNKDLEAKILALADEANIPAEHVYEVNMSEKTSSLNAYVTGIGPNSRIVLWDTTLERLSEDEILFIMAHEMGHYVEKHIYFGMAGYVLLSFFGLWITAVIMRRVIRRQGGLLNLRRVQELKSLPLFLLVISILLFASSPLTNWVSRYEEKRADHYALQMTEDRSAAVKTFQDLTKYGLSQVNPPFLVKIFRYGHPTMLERISMAEEVP